MNFFHIIVALGSMASYEYKECLRLSVDTINYMKVCHPRIAPALVTQTKIQLINVFNENVDSFNKIETFKFFTHLKNRQAKLLFNAETDCFAIPLKLKSLNYRDLANVFHFKSIQQDDNWSCGYWSSLNAFAINDVLGRGANLSSSNMKAVTLTYCKKTQEKQSLDGKLADSHLLVRFNKKKEPYLLKFIEEDAVDEFCENLGILNTYTLGYFGDYGDQNAGIVCNTGNPNNVIYVGGTGAQVRAQFFAARRAEIAAVPMAQDFCLHFVCNISKVHWILVSVVKLANKNPVLVLMDSLNWALNEKLQSADYVELIYNELVRPFLNRP